MYSGALVQVQCFCTKRIHPRHKVDTAESVSILSQNSQHLGGVQGQKILTVEAEFGSSLISSFIRSWTLSCTFNMAKTYSFSSNYGYVERPAVKCPFQGKRGFFSSILKLQANVLPPVHLSKLLFP